jgi:hypothetical protein
MTARENRGGPRVPDGVPRPPTVTSGARANRQDMSQLPGTPGTPLPEGIGGIDRGQVGPAKRPLANIPLDRFNPSKAGLLSGPSRSPQEPVTSGIGMGAGPGPDSVIQGPNLTNNQDAARELASIYPVIMRLAVLPSATTQTKILAQRLRANMPIKPEQIPRMNNGNSRQA